MTQPRSATGAPTRAEATQGVEERLVATLHAFPGLRLAAIPAQFLRTLPEATGSRVLRGGHLPDVDGAAADEVFQVVRDLWQDAGCAVEDNTGLDGRLLVVRDPAGYLLTLARQGADDPILTVASPPMATPLVDRALLAGLLGGFALGCFGPCLASVLPMTAFPSLAGLRAPYWGWVPLYLLVGLGSLWLPETRKFGAGLLVSGAIVGITVAGILS